MTTITREQLRERAREKVKSLEFAVTQTAFSENRAELEEELELARIALASLEAEPVGTFRKGPCGYSPSFHEDAMPLYAAPPAPVSVPDLKPVGFLFVSDDGSVAYSPAGWPMKGFNLIGPIYGDVNACRAAMLQSGNFRENKNSSTNNFREIAETSTNYPVIPSEVLSAIQKVAKIRADFDDFDGDRRGIGDCLDEAEQELIVTINKYASQLAAEPIAPNDVREQTAIPQVPVTPDGWVMVPKELTPEMMRAVQIRSELGGYATSNLSGAYNMFSEFWNVAVSAAPKVDDL